jgi:hypothetical protein
VQALIGLCQRLETAETFDVLAHSLQNAKTKPRLRKEARIEKLRAFFGDRPGDSAWISEC